MSRHLSWNLVALGLLLALGLHLLFSTVIARPAPTLATECISGGEEGGGADTATLLIRFREGSTSGPLTVYLGFRVTVSPNPLLFTHDGSRTADDNGLNDDDDESPEVGSITIDDACQTNHEDFLARHYDLVASIAPGSPAALKGCRLPNAVLNNVTVVGSEGVVREINFVVFCDAQEPVAAAAGSSAGGLAPVVAARPPVIAAPGQPAGCEPVQSGPASPLVGPLIIEVLAVGSEQTPPVEGLGRSFARFAFLGETRELSFFVTFLGLSPDQITAAHIHRGPRGANGPIVLTIPLTGFSQSTGTLTLSEADAADLLAGNLYFNVHSKDNPDGFARGQLNVPQAVSPGVAPVVACPQAPAPAAAAAAPGVARITPPNTGDAGLAEGSSSASGSLAALVSFLVAAIAGVSLTRRANNGSRGPNLS